MTLENYATLSPIQTVKNQQQFTKVEQYKSDSYKLDKNDDYAGQDSKSYQSTRENSAQQRSNDKNDDYYSRSDRTEDTASTDRSRETDHDRRADKSDEADKKEDFKSLVKEDSTNSETEATAAKNDIATMFVDGQNLSQEQKDLINTALEKISLTQATAQTNIDTQNTVIAISSENLATEKDATIGQLLLLEGKNPDQVSSSLFNLSSEQMDQLQSDITAALEGTASDSSDANADVNFIILNLTQPTQSAATTPAADDFVNTLPFAKQNSKDGEVENVSSNNVNNLLQNSGGIDTFDDLMDIQSSTDKFSALLKNATRLKQQAEGDYTAQNNLPTDNAKNAQNAGNQPQTQQQNAQNLTTSAASLDGAAFGTGDFTASMGWDADTLTSMGLASSGTPATQSSQSAQLVNLTTQARSAAQAHPSTAIVSAAMNKSVNAKGDTTINIQLDPPELGRVEIRMEFGQDRTLKAKIITEKPEAHLLLQRDSHSLERALQDSGLDMENASLEFSLAEDGQNFNQNGGHDGSRNQAQYGGSSEEESDLVQIETTMTWTINPETGHTHYSILA